MSAVVLQWQRCALCQASFAAYEAHATTCDSCAGHDWPQAVQRLRAAYQQMLDNDVPKTAVSAALHRVIADLDRLLARHA